MPPITPPDTSRQTLLQAVQLHRDGDLAQAERLYLAILEAEPQQPDALHNLGVLELHSARPQHALRRLLAALQANPSQPQYWLSCADALTRLGDAAGLQQLMEAARQQGASAELLSALQARQRGAAEVPAERELEALLALYQQGRYDQAEPLARDLVRDHPRHAAAWKLLAALQRQRGRPLEALATLQHAAMLAPGDAEVHGNLGNALRSLGRLEEAVASYRQALQLQPAFFEVQVNLGNTLRELGQLPQACACYEAALALRPQDAVAHNNLGLALNELGQPRLAEQHCRQALALQPDFAEAHNNLALVLLEQGLPEQAQASCLCALALKPDHASAHNNLGNAWKALGQPERAQASYRQALALKPDYAEACNNLGSVLHELHRQDEAEAALRQALRLRPGYAAALSNLGAVLHERGRSVEALALHRQALQNQPGHATSHNNLGILLNDLGRRDDAITSYQQALQLDPRQADTHNNLGVVLNDIGRQDEAIASFRQALTLRPDYPEAHNNLGTALKDLGRFDEALDSFRRALELRPDYAEAHDNLLFVLNYHPDKSAEEVFAAYAQYDRQFGSPAATGGGPAPYTRTGGQRLRVGYVSPDFRQHSCMYFLEPLLAGHDKRVVEVFAYAELAAEDATTARYRGYVDHWVPTRGLSDDALARRIQEDRIDILVDLAGHTRGNRLRVFAAKPAPVAVSWLGFGCTTGLRAVDYFLGDAQVAPAGCEALFSETPWRLDGPGLVYRPAPGMGDPGPLPALRNGYVTFGTLTRAVRINHRTLAAWAAILHRVPDARLIINSGDFRSAHNQEALAQRFAPLGIARERLMIGYHSPAWDVLRETDISLDCFPHNSGTTLFESLYMGVPFVSLAGRPGVGRLGCAILHGAGHPEWSADSEQDYVARAVALAQDAAQLAATRAALRGQMARSPLMDEAGFVRQVEAAYLQMCAAHACGAG